MEEAKRPMTTKEILTDIVRILGNIDVPVSRIEQIGIPIARCINGVQVCIEAITREEEEEPKITLEKVDSIPEEEEGNNA